MKYEFRSANGQVCCSGDTFAHLCSAYKEKARSISAPGAAATGAGLRPSGVPSPPDLASAIRAKRAVSRLTQVERRDKVRQFLAAQPRPMADGSRP